MQMHLDRHDAFMNKEYCTIIFICCNLKSLLLVFWFCFVPMFSEYTKEFLHMSIFLFGLIFVKSVLNASTIAFPIQNQFFFHLNSHILLFHFLACVFILVSIHKYPWVFFYHCNPVVSLK